MSKKDRLKEKIINIFFEEDKLTEEERRQEERSFLLFLKWMTSLAFVFFAILIIYAFFKGRLNIHDISGAAALGITIITGLGALYFDSRVKKSRN